MNLIILYHDPYYDLHGTLSLSYINELADLSNTKACCFFDKRSEEKLKFLEKQYHKNINFIDVSNYTDDIYSIMYDEFNPHIEKLCEKLCLKFKPKKILFFNEFYFLKYFRKIDASKIYFVRSLSKPLLQALKKTATDSLQSESSIRIEEKRGRAEILAMSYADLFVVDSNCSQKALKGYYNETSILITGFINKQKYAEVRPPNFDLLSAYFLGRIDWQKGLHRLKNPISSSLEIIGDQILTKGGVDGLDNARYHSWMKFEDYKQLISPIPFALFPHIWESNGLTVQEALTMGKIVVVQVGSGGCEEYIKHGINGFLFDFGLHEDWEFFIKNIKNSYDLEYVSKAARHTIPGNGYEKSIQILAEIIRGT